MKVGILGTGEVGRTLGAGFANLGHEVRIGSREPGSDKVQAWVKQTGARASSGTFAETAAFAEVAVLATLWSGTESALQLAGAKNLAGKVVIDATNPLVFQQGKPPALALGHDDSGGEQVQRWLPDARVVKAFNIVGHAHMVKPQFPGGPPDMFICGNDADAKKTVSQICKDFGWGVIDLGAIDGSRYLEPMCMTWVLHGVLTGSWTHAFKMLHAANK